MLGWELPQQSFCGINTHQNSTSADKNIYYTLKCNQNATNESGCQIVVTDYTQDPGPKNQALTFYLSDLQQGF